MAILIMDVGSSSVRALIAISENALRTIALAKRDYQFDTHSTIDASQLRQWVEDCIDEVLRHPAIPRIHAVGMATFVGNLLGVDENNHPTTPTLTYADNRSHESAQILSAQVDTPAVHARTGCRVHTAYHPAKLHWLNQTMPDVVQKTACWLDFATYCYRAWFGRDVPCSYSIASWSGLLNRESLTWDGEWLTHLGLSDQHLPILADYNDTQHGLSAPYAHRWSALRDVPFYLAVGDGAGANIGSGGVSSDRPVVTIGTTAALRIVTHELSDLHPALWSYRVDKHRHLVGGSTNEGGNIFAWAKNTFHLPIQDMDDALLRCEPASHGLTVLPLLAGERSPNYHESAMGTIHGLRLQTTPLQLVHALLEGVGLRLRLILDALNMPSDFILAGGGALYHSEAWSQILADCLDRPLYLIAEREVTAQGVYWLIESPKMPIQPRYEKQFFPRKHYRQHYDHLLEQQQALYNSLYRKG